MKVTLELEENDLREMLEGYFKQNGFVVKNLEDICQDFVKAYPSGIQVRAEIGPPPPTAMAMASSSVDDSDTESDTTVEDSALSLDDLLDPTPRIRRVAATRDTDENDIARLVRVSKSLERP